MAGGGWSSLPTDLLKEVCSRLTSDADHLHIHQVCPPWRASTSLPAAFRPWVLAGRLGGSGLVPIADYSLRLPRGGAPRVEVGAPPASLPYCCGTSRGWLALVDDARSPTRLVLWEPLSNAEIPLPCLSPLSRIFLSDDPLTSSSSSHSNWIAIATQIKGLLGQKMLFWRPGDAAWTMLYERGTSAVDTIAFHGGKAYYMDIQGEILICDFNTATATDPPPCTRICNVWSVVNKLCGCDGGVHPAACGVRGVHLAPCNGELLFVVLRLGGHPSSWAEVYRPEWMHSRHRLELRERVMDLGDYSLFIGRGDAFALSAKDFPAVRRNCIYYADKPYRYLRYWISVFHLESNVVEEIAYPMVLHQDEAVWMPYVWFCPRKPFL